MDYFDRERPAPDVTECFDSPDGRELIADVFLPSPEKSQGAAVLFVHGGGWNAGSRHAFLWHAHRLSLHGYVTCTIDYRLSQEAPFPAAIVDCQSAVKWLRRNAERFGFCGDRIGAVGSSAGGHLVACLGVFETQGEDLSDKVNCVVDVHGVHDLVTAVEQATEVNKNLQAFIGWPLAEKRDLWIAASPALHVDGTAAPMLLIHDPHDDTVPYDQSLLLANVLMANGRPVQLLPSPGSGHGFVYGPQNEWTQRVWPVLVAWLDQHLASATLTEFIEEEGAALAV